MLVDGASFIKAEPPHQPEDLPNLRSSCREEAAKELETQELPPMSPNQRH